jgi:hypothetical protein
MIFCFFSFLGSAIQVLDSRFAPDKLDAETHRVSSADTITFNRTVCTITAETGTYLLTECCNTETALLECETVFLSASDRGKTKDVYGVCNSNLQRPAH